MPSVNLMHISFNSELEGVWTPKLPETLGNGVSIYSEPEIPRVCLAPSIKECFWAIYPNVSDLFEHTNYPYMDFYVYTPEITPGMVVVPPEQLTAKRLVLDAHVTNEHWVLSEVNMKRTGKVRIYNPGQCRFVSFRPYNKAGVRRLDLAPAMITFDEWSFV